MLFKKLDLEKRNELRKKILKELENVPEGTRIKLDKKILDQLIFFKFKNKKTNEQCKAPVWTGEFLRKLDLSELSFENAYLDILYFNETEVNKYEKRLFNSELCMNDDDSKVFIEEYKNCNDEKILKGPYAFDFSYTNIKLDFKSTKSITDRILSCNFEGVDLSKSKFEDFVFYSCNMKNTRLNQFDTKYLKYRIDCDLSDNNLSNITVDVNGFTDGEYCENFAGNRNKYKNTGLKIKYIFHLDEQDKLHYDIMKNKGLIDGDRFPIDYEIDDDYDNIDKYKEAFGNISKKQIELLYWGAYWYAKYLTMNHNFVEKIKRGDFDGCYLNGKLIDSKTINEQPESYEELMSSITESIEEQKRNFGK